MGQKVIIKFWWESGLSRLHPATVSPLLQTFRHKRVF